MCLTRGRRDCVNVRPRNRCPAFAIFMDGSYQYCGSRFEKSRRGRMRTSRSPFCFARLTPSLSGCFLHKCAGRGNLTARWQHSNSPSSWRSERERMVEDGGNDNVKQHDGGVRRRFRVFVMLMLGHQIS